MKADITIADLDAHAARDRAGVDVIRDQLLRNHIELVDGTARFTDARLPCMTGRAPSAASQPTAS